MSSPQRLYTADEYLALDNAEGNRIEYADGHIYPMAGAEPDHEQITLNVGAQVLAGIRDRACRVFGSNMRLKVQASRAYRYPDVSGLCGPAEFEPTRPQTLLNPSFIVEVLSPSTEAYDRGVKFAHYQLIPSLSEYLLVAQDHMRVERYLRAGTSWTLDQFTQPDDVLELPSVECVLRVGDLYAHVEFPDGPPPTAPRLVREDADAWGAAV